MPKLEQFEIKKYWQIFSGLKPKENKLSHEQVLPVLYNSKLDTSILNKIWFLADIDDDDLLDFEEFVICMRMIFDMVNQNIDSVPDELPDWLVPGSKADLVKQRLTEHMASATSSNLENTRNEDASRLAASQPPKEIDWYISPQDKNVYESIYESAISSRDRSVNFVSLASSLKSRYINLSSQDIEAAWRLVNPKLNPSIDKDPALYLIHILRQVNDFGCQLPIHLPAALQETFNKFVVSTDLSSKQGDLRRPTLPTKSSYKSQKKEGTDFSVTEGTDWEVVRLQRELANIDSELSFAQQQSIEHDSATSGIYHIKEQFEGLLNHRQAQLNGNSNSQFDINLRGLQDDINNIAEQVQTLEQYLSSKKTELHNLNIEISSLQ